ncbi:hypothetical protein JBE04_00770 [Streptomyces sp. PRKS01-29]|nr:hypothetical protein [Streptomyces sabulosicollis]MBI0293067.1 hypothetical protein [Streptomyces sabulosicollis]
MDLNAVADELYALPPADFTAARDERAKEARSAGDRKLAEGIRRLRRPTQAAWASNLLVRRQPDEAEQVLRLGAALRQAHQDLDGGQLRKLSAQQRQVIAALARQARDLTARAGQPIGEGAQREVEETLRAVLADPDAGRDWVRGRLAKPLTAPTGFTPVAGAARSAPPTTPRRGERAPGSRVADLDAARSRRRERQEQERQREQQERERRRERQERERRRDQRERQARARQEAGDAERQLRAREEELTAAEEEHGRADQLKHQARQRLADLRKRLKEAEEEDQEADEAAREAHRRLRDADRAVREARRRATDAAARAERLADRAEPPTV